MKNMIKVLILLLMIFSLVLYSETVFKSCSEALATCFNVLLPSLFPFFVLSRIFISSGCAEIIGRVFTPIMRLLFKIQGNGATAFILGIISGYPTGAKSAVDLYNQSCVTKKEAESLICFCNNSGPLFIIGALGVGLLSSKEAGVYLYIIHILSSVTLGIILRSTIPAIAKHPFKLYTNNSKTNIFIESVESSVLSVINIFAYVIFFAIMTDICETSNIFHTKNNSVLNSIIFSIIEMTTGIKKLSAADCTLSIKLVLSSFMLGWSGLSIHMQTKSILDKADLSFKKYLIFKLLHGIIASLYTLISLRFISSEKFVFLNYSDKVNINPGVSVFPTTLIVIIISAYFTVQLRLKYSSQYSKLKQKTAK